MRVHPVFRRTIISTPDPVTPLSQAIVLSSGEVLLESDDHQLFLCSTDNGSVKATWHVGAILASVVGISFRVDLACFPLESRQTVPSDSLFTASEGRSTLSGLWGKA